MHKQSSWRKRRFIFLSLFNSNVVFPFLVVRWQVSSHISHAWSVKIPFSATRWQVSHGAKWRQCFTWPLLQVTTEKSYFLVYHCCCFLFLSPDGRVQQHWHVAGSPLISVCVQVGRGKTTTFEQWAIRAETFGERANTSVKTMSRAVIF